MFNESDGDGRGVYSTFSFGGRDTLKAVSAGFSSPDARLTSDSQRNESCSAFGDFGCSAKGARVALVHGAEQLNEVFTVGATFGRANL